MDNSFENLQKDWKQAQTVLPKSEAQSKEMMQKAKKEVTNSRNMQIWNVAILSFTFVGVAAFFYFIAPVQEAVSRIGVALMLTGLLIRIAAEIISIDKARHLRANKSAAELNEEAIHYHTFRKKIHGTFTTVILVAYVIGIIVLIPEFSLYLSTAALAVIGVSSILGAAVVGYSIRTGIRNELIILKRLEDLQQSIEE